MPSRSQKGTSVQMGKERQGTLRAMPRAASKPRARSQSSRAPVRATWSGVWAEWLPIMNGIGCATRPSAPSPREAEQLLRQRRFAPGCVSSAVRSPANGSTSSPTHTPADAKAELLRLSRSLQFEWGSPQGDHEVGQHPVRTEKQPTCSLARLIPATTAPGLIVLQRAVRLGGEVLATGVGRRSHNRLACPFPTRTPRRLPRTQRPTPGRPHQRGQRVS